MLKNIAHHANFLKEIYLTVPWNKRLRRFLQDSVCGQYIDMFSAFLSVVTLLTYILETYFELGKVCEVVELVCGGFFAVEYFIRVSIADQKFQYLLSWESLIDTLTILPPFLRLALVQTKVLNFGFLRVARLLRLLRVLRVHRLLSRTDSLVQRKVLVLFFSMFSLIFCAAGAFLEAEHEQLTYFHDGLYWAAVTLATVGYGDIHPETDLGKLVVILTIVLVITMVPYHTNELVNLLTKHSVYERAIYSTSVPGRHIVLAGSVCPIAFKDFIEEFFHKDHGFDDKDVVILSPNPPERSLELLVRCNEHIVYIQGSPMIRKDITRTAARYAAAIFIFCDKQSTKPKEEDETNLLISLSISQYLQGEAFANKNLIPRILIEVLLPDTRSHLVSFMVGPANVQQGKSRNSVPAAKTFKPYVSVLCLLELKLALLARSCLGCPGLITLICNLCRSVDLKRPSENTQSKWRQEYLRGASMEIYRTPLSPVFVGKTYKEVTELIYKNFGAILIGIETFSSRNHHETSTFPQRRTPLITAELNQILSAATDKIVEDVSQTAGFVIAPNLETCLEIASCEMPFFVSKATSRNKKLAHFTKTLSEAEASSSPHQVVSMINLDNDSPKEESGDAFVGVPIKEEIDDDSDFSPSTSPETRVSRQRSFGLLPGFSNIQTLLNGLSHRPQTIPGSSLWDHLEQPQGEYSSFKFPFSTRHDTLGEEEDSEEFHDLLRKKTSRSAPELWKVLKTAVQEGHVAPRSSVSLATDMISNTIRKASHLRRSYHIRRTPWSLKEATIYEVDFFGHLIVFGISGVRSLFHFVAPLRCKTLSKIIPIVLVDRSLLEPVKWNEISMFQAIYFFQGSAQSSDDLRRLAIPRASKAVILPNLQCTVHGVYHEARLDADVVLTYNQLMALHPRLEIFMDVNTAKNLSFLMPRLEHGKGNTADFLTSPFFASGMVFLSGFMDTLFCQAFYNSDILRILKRILIRNEPTDELQARGQHGKRAATSVAANTKHPLHLTQISTPPEFINSSFGSLFSFYLQQGYICVGIYRKKPDARGNSTPYVYTNPPSELILEELDNVYLLSELVPNRAPKNEENINPAREGLEPGSEAVCCISRKLSSQSEAKKVATVGCSSRTVSKDADTSENSNTELSKIVETILISRTQTMDELEQVREEIQELKRELSK